MDDFMSPSPPVPVSRDAVRLNKNIGVFAGRGLFPLLDFALRNPSFPASPPSLLVASCFHARVAEWQTRGT